MFSTTHIVSDPTPGRALRRDVPSKQRRRLEHSALVLSLALTAHGWGCSEPNYHESEDIGSAGRGPNSAVRDSGDVKSADAARDGAGPDPSAPNARDAEAAGTSNEAGAPNGPGAPTDTGQPDATPPIDSASDAGVTTPPAPQVLPAWARPLIGRYASRGYTFKQDEFTITRAEELSYVEFSPNDAGSLTLRTKFCSLVATTTLAELRIKQPRALPDRIETVVLSEADQRWKTEGPKLASGFTREPPAFCAGKIGQDVPRSTEQVWLAPSTTCRCADAKEDPLVDDCRVLDPDHDMKPGLTYELKGMTTSFLNATVYAGNESNSRYVNGVVSADGTGHTANISADDQAYQFGCEPQDCGNIAVLGRFCPESQNRVRFVRLSEAQTPPGMDPCEAIVAERRTLFPEPALAYPTRCFQ